MSTSPYTRVNGEMLKNFRGHQVSLLGKLKKLSQDQCSLELDTFDGKTVLVKLKMPIRDMLSEYIEVYGSVDEKGNIICVNYASFDQSFYHNFDSDMYNETLKLAHQLDKHFIQAL